MDKYTAFAQLSAMNSMWLNVQQMPVSSIRQHLSSIFGSISFSCWIILMVPQLVEQWRLKTVDGISPIFLLMWSLGDIFNLIGSIWAGLLPEVIIIALWFLFADLFTLAFYFYIKTVYDKKRNSKHKKQKNSNTVVVVDDETLLLGEHAIHYEHEIPNNESFDSNYGATSDLNTHSHNHNNNNNNNHHHHHHKNHADRRKSQSSTLEDIIYEPENHSIFVKYTLPLLLVICAGTFGSILSPNGSSNSIDSNSIKQQQDSLGPQICGYLSAFLYLTARFPQIFHNYQKKSTKGLSLLFFLFTMLGNITYSLQIVVYRSDYDYLMLNLSWLLGSFGTIAEDLIIVAQFYLYRENDSKINSIV
ncbi:hypothetical protein C6P40_003084 [Pichia californica]|uniref:Uncharacterized protein n=1 Tax=Pichia californica TaxID=460514 RepID=A0A9P6WNS2_9ASCO|nr:hypothetical protein C6P40_003084 [[Candida] californica]